MTERTVAANPFARQWAATADDVLGAVRRVGESGHYVLGAEVAAFERELGERIGRRHVVGCASGLDAIEIGLRAAGLQAGQRVLTTPLSAFATTLAIVRAGGVPVFTDVDETGLLDLERAADCLAKDRSIRHLVPVHLFGQALERGALSELVERFDLVVVEDCAQAVGASSGTHAVGRVGEAAAFSFYPTKNLGALGDGGAVAFDDERLAQNARALRDYGQSAKYVHDRLGLNSRLDELQAAILRSAYLPRLEAWTGRRVAIAERYLQGLAHAEVTPLPAPPASVSVWHLFPVRVPSGARADFLEHLLAGGVQAGIHYPATIPDQEALASVDGATVVGELSEARRLAAEEVSLPIHPFLEKDEIEHVIGLVNGWRA